MGYDELISQLAKVGIEVVEDKAISPYKGLCINNILTINPSITTSVEKKCVLAEEIGHYYTTAGDIRDQSKPGNRKQEKIARALGYEILIPIDSFLEAYWTGINSRYELAEFFDVTEDFLQEALDHYKEKYGNRYKIGDYMICFDPLAVGEIQEGGDTSCRKDRCHGKRS
jgi:hypothetical protein